MSREYYLEKVKDLPYDEQVQELKNAYITFSLCKDDYSDKMLIICEILANEYKVFDYQVRLAEEYYKNGEFQKVITYTDCFVNNHCAEHGANAIYSLDAMFFYKAQACEELGHIEQAVQSYSQVCTNIKVKSGGKTLSEVDKTNLATCYFNIGTLLLDLDEDNRAFAAFSEAWQNKPTTSCAIYLGMLFAGGIGTSKDVESAESFLIMAVSTEDISDKESALANYHLGKIYSTEDGYIDKIKAREHLQKAQAKGYSISDAEINQMLNSISKPKKKSFFGLW